jgi:hypothetical protein
VKDEQGGVEVGLNKTKSEEVRGEPAVSSRGCLLEPVERFVEAADLVRLRGINKPHWLAAVDCLQERPCRNAFFTLSWWTRQERKTARESTARMVADLTTRLKVS